MKFNFEGRTLLAIAVSMALSGCAAYTDKRDVDAQVTSWLGDTSSRFGSDMRKVTREQKYANQEVDLPFLASQPRPLSRDADLPLVLQGKVPITSVFPDGGFTDLTTAARRLQEASGLLVQVKPDALLPLSDFGPRLSESMTGRTGHEPGTEALTSTNTFSTDDPIYPGTAESFAVPAASSSSIQTPQRVKPKAGLKGEQRLDVVLDQVTAPLGVYWKWDPDARRVIIYRTETRTFEIRGAELNPSGSLAVNQTGAIGETGNNAVDSKSQTQLDMPRAEGSQISDIVKRITQFTTRAGQVASGSGGLVIVTDTKEALDRIQNYVDEENRIRGRMIEFTLEEITVEVTSSSQAGASWNLMFNSTGAGNEVNVNGLNSLLEQEGAAASLGAAVGNGPWKGSSIAVQALSKVGKVVSRITDSSGSAHGDPVTLGDPERRKYIDKLTLTPSSSDSSGPTVAAEQAVEVSGRMVTIVPFAYANGDAKLAFKFDNTQTAEKIEKNVFPDGSYVQSPHLRGTILARTAFLRSGQPYVIKASLKDSNGYNANRVDRHAPMLLGGSDVTDRTERVTLLVLTTMVKER